MILTSRRVRGLASLAIAVLAVAAIVVAATRADGRDASREDTNDGGAWLVDRRAQAVGHVDRASRQVSGAVKVADRGEQFSIDQADGIIAVHNQADDTVTLLDPRTYRRTATVEVPDGAVMHAADGALVVATLDPLRAWRLPVGDIGSISSLEDAAPVLTGGAPSLVEVTRAGSIVAVDGASGTIHHVAVDGTARHHAEAVPADPVAITAIGEDVVVVDADGRVIVAGAAGVSGFDGGAMARDGVLQQPGLASPVLVLVDADGRVVSLATDSGRASVLAELPGHDALPPIVHGGCVFAVVQQPVATFARVCGDDLYTRELTGLTGSELRLRLVNGWVWINALDSGEAWVAGLEGELDEVEDIGEALARNSETGERIQGTGPDARQVSDPDGSRLGNQDRLEGGPNKPPVARDDQVDARTDRPVVVEVLRNDDDPNGDVLLVESVSGLPADAVVVPTANRGAVQVTPAAGFAGTVRFSYVVTDGYGGSDDATVTVDFSPADPDTNRAPEPVDDVAATSPGTSVSLDVLANDTDPDGDTLALVEVTGEGGRIVWSASGSLTFTPAETTTTNLELSYVVADDFGATATGRVVVNIRPVEEDSRPPDARNDAAVTVVGKAVTLDVLANDIDPDGDPLSVSAQPTLATSPSEGQDVYSSMTTDGIFLVDPDVAGTYVWVYTISDGANSDAAQIRVEVGDADQNRPPVAVRDDVVIPVGGTRVVPVLRNDGDPDGDVVGIVNWVGAPGLVVEAVTGVGFRVTVTDTAAPRETFQYQISDGVNDPVGTSVVVTVTDTPAEDQPPVAQPDVVEAQPGQPTTLDVLVNDHDPEGGPLQVVGHSDPSQADVSIGPAGAHLVLELRDDATSGFSFGYEVADEAGNRGSATVQVRVIRPEDPNRPPVARPDVVTTLEDQPVAIDALANDSDPDGDVIRVESIAAQPDNGVVVLGDDGTLAYTPDAGFTGTDRFAYTLVDARGARVRGDVLVGVMPQFGINRPPQAVDDVLEVVAGLGVQPLDVLANDRDPDGDPIEVVDTSTPSIGQADVASGGAAVLFTPPDQVDGDEVEVALRYTIDDGAGHQDDAIVTVRILPEGTPQPPVALDDRAGPTVAGSTVTVDVLANDHDPDGQVADLEIGSDDPAVEVVDGQLEITADELTRSYVYTVTDADGLSASASVTVVVLENRPPTIEPLRVETPFETPIELDLTGQASDPDSDELTFTCCDGERGGTAAVTSPDSTTLRVTFTPDTGFDGEAGFSYRADDGHGHEVSGSVIVTVLAPTNRPPVATDTALDVEVGRSVDLDLASLVEDPDVSDTLRIDVAGVDGPMQVGLAGTVATLTPDETATGESARLTYTATDGTGATDSGVVTVAITPSSLPPPEAQADQARTTQGTAVTVPVLANDVGEGLRIESTTVAEGTIQVAADGQSLTYTPGPDFFGSTQATYAIRDRFDVAERTSTGQVTLTVIGYPDAPAPPSVVADSNQATLTWSTPEDNGAPIDGYRLQAIVGGELVDQVETDATTTYTWTGLDNGTEYRFRVQAHNEAGWGPASSSSVAVTPDTLPGRPAVPTVAFGDRQLVVSWSAPPNEGTPITSYVLEIGGGTSGARTIPAQGDENSYTWEGLVNGTDYTFRVRAVNDKGQGTFSAWSQPEHPLTSPSAPAKPTLDNGPNYLDVNWNVPENGGDQIISYQVQIEDGQQTTRTIGGESTTSYRWSDLPNGVEFRFRVRATNRDPQPGAWSPWSEPGKACDVPGPPTSPGAVRGDRQARVTWTAPPDNGCTVTSYEVRVVGTSNVQTTDGSSTSLQFTGLTNGQSYRFEVRAVNEIGPGPWSAPTNAVTPAGPPTAPTNISTTRTGNFEITTTIEPGSANGSPITGYQVSLNSGPWRGKAMASGNRFVFGGLAENTQYCVRVRAVNDVGPGSASNSRCARTLGPPGTPTGFSANGINGAVRFSWNAASGEVGSYRVDRDGASNVNVGLNRSYDWSANYPTVRRARVRACNAAGCSGWTAFRQARPDDPRRVTISKGDPGGCGSASCRYVDIAIRDFSPNVVVHVTCQEYKNGRWEQFAGTSGWYYTTNGSGDVTRDNICYFGYPGQRIRAKVTGDPGGTKYSNVIVW